MTEYFAVLAVDDRRGPFGSRHEPVALLKQTCRERGYTEEQARYFFLHESAVEQVDTIGDKSDCFCVGWLAREQSGRDEELLPGDKPEAVSEGETVREREDALADAHFTLTSRKAAEVNEGGLVDPRVP